MRATRQRRLTRLEQGTKDAPSSQHAPSTNIKELLQRTFDEWNRHNAAQLGASLSYYATLSLAPMLMLFVAIIGLVYGPDAARGGLNQQLERFVGDQAAAAIQQGVASTSNPSTGTLASVLGGLMLLVGASSVAIALQNALNLIGTCPRGRFSNGGCRTCGNAWSVS